MNRGHAALLLGVLSVSTAAAMFKEAAAPALVAGFWRLAIATALLAPFAGRDLWVAVRNPRTLGFQVVTGLFLGLHFGVWIESLFRTSVAASLVLVTMHPVVVAAFGALALKERPDGRGLGGILVSLVGVGILAFAGGFDGTRLTGNLLAFIGALAMAAYLVAGRRARASIPLLAWVVPVYAVAAITLAVSAVIAGQPLTGYAPKQWMLFGALAIVPMILGHTMFNYALATVPAWVVSTAILGEPAFGSVFAWLVLGELPARLEVLGGVIALAGVYLVLRRSRAAQRAATAGSIQGSG